MIDSLALNQLSTELPASLKRLWDVAYNLRWAWNHDAVTLFQRLDAELWESCSHNPVAMLKTLDRERAFAAAGDEVLLAHLRRVADDLETYLADESTWFARKHPDKKDRLVAYFSAEFGLTECLPIYSGGLGVLAGDHLKSASDLGVPLVAVGLLYRYGYFRQQLDPSGWQRELYPAGDFESLPLQLERRSDGDPLTVRVEFPGRPVTAQVWRAQVGRVPLYLLDTDIEANTQEDRYITGHLYGGNLDTRIRQEIILGFGGFRALEALGIEPDAYHMNEGHAAFLALERVRRLMERRSLCFKDALEAGSEGLVFTTHTPVPAGHDYFPPELMDRYFGGYLETVGVRLDDFLALGRRGPEDPDQRFVMTILALRAARHSNGVSELHGEVSRRMWQGLYPDKAESEVPIEHITNGVHLPTWVSRPLDELFDRTIGSHGVEEPPGEAMWRRVGKIPAVELWAVHEGRRARLAEYVRDRLRAQLGRHGAAEPASEASAATIDPKTLTIGFARRFATYKRAAMLMRDPDRLARILGDPDRPAQVLFAGKAHPQDEGGKELIRRIVELSREDRFRGRLVFLEDYDMALARRLVQGVDVWLNNPQRPLEASGTSGMKAAANGALNLSTLDGWWAEAWERHGSGPDPVGWAIGEGEVLEDAARQEELEAEALYTLLEREVAPLFYDRDSEGLPHAWIRRMKASISKLSPRFNTHRMLQEYTERFYLPAEPSRE